MKELKSACSTYGLNSPFIQSLIESLCDEALPPCDWLMLAKTCLSGFQYLLWKSNWTDFCSEQAQTNRMYGINITLDMLTGTGQFTDLEQQLNYDFHTYAQISKCARRAWRELSTEKEKTLNFSQILQEPDESFSVFVVRLYQAANRMIGDSSASEILVKHLAFENANKVCQKVIKPHHKRGTISDYIRLCSDIGLAYMQGIAIAAAIKQVFQPPLREANSKRQCFNCGRRGHLARDCKRLQGQRNVPGICPRCLRGRHWVRECPAQRGINGPLFPMQQGNWRQCQPQPH